MIELLVQLGDKQGLTRNKAAKQLSQYNFSQQELKNASLVLRLMSNSKRWEDRLGSLVGAEYVKNQDYL